MKNVRKVHISYIEIPKEEWVVADGGRCYKAKAVREHLQKQVQCPDCKKWLRTEESYQQHWDSCHKDA